MESRSVSKAHCLHAYLHNINYAYFATNVELSQPYTFFKRRE